MVVKPGLAEHRWTKKLSISLASPTDVKVRAHDLILIFATFAVYVM